jgi:hypothetical protein
LLSFFLVFGFLRFNHTLASQSDFFHWCFLDKDFIFDCFLLFVLTLQIFADEYCLFLFLFDKQSFATYLDFFFLLLHLPLKFLLHFFHLDFKFFFLLLFSFYRLLLNSIKLNLLKACFFSLFTDFTFFLCLFFGLFLFCLLYLFFNCFSLLLKGIFSFNRWFFQFHLNFYLFLLCRFFSLFKFLLSYFFKFNFTSFQFF